MNLFYDGWRKFCIIQLGGGGEGGGEELKGGGGRRRGECPNFLYLFTFHLS